MIYRVQITPFRIEWCRSDAGYASGELVMIKSKEGIDIGRVVSLQKDEAGSVYGEILRQVTEDDLERRRELQEYEDFGLIEFKKAVQEFNASTMARGLCSISRRKSVSSSVSSTAIFLRS